MQAVKDPLELVELSHLHCVCIDLNTSLHTTIILAQLFFDKKNVEIVNLCAV